MQPVRHGIISAAIPEDERSAGLSLNQIYRRIEAERFELDCRFALEFGVNSDKIVLSLVLQSMSGIIEERVRILVQLRGKALNNSRKCSRIEVALHLNLEAEIA